MSNTQHYQGGQKQNSVRCQICRIIGHTGNLCPKRFDYSRVKCQICHIIGHPGNLCPQRFASNFIGGSTVSRQPSISQAYPKALSSVPTCGKTPEFLSTDWYIDTGATHHVTSDYNILTDVMPYYGSDTVQVGDGSGL